MTEKVLSDEEKQKLNDLLSALNFSEESIKNTSTQMLALSKEGFPMEWMNLWRDHEGQKKDINKLAYYYVMHDAIVRFQEDEHGLLKEFPNVLNEIFKKSLIDWNDPYFRSSISALVGAWKQSQLYSESYIGYLERVVADVEAEYPTEKNVRDAGIPFKVKSFAVYLSNYNKSKDRLAQLESELTQIKKSGIDDPNEYKSKVDDYEKTLYSMKIQKNGLLKSMFELTKDFKQKICVRLHKIQETETLKETVTSLIEAKTIN